MSGGTGDRAARTRTALVQAATELVAEQGWARATARAIGARAQCNQALIFYHFGSVEGLLVAALQQVSERRMAAFAPALDEVDSTQTALVLLRRIVEQDVTSGDLSYLVALIDASRDDAVLRAGVLECLAPWQQLVERLLYRVLEPNPLGDLIPVPDLARVIMSGVLGLELLHSIDPVGTQGVLELSSAVGQLLQE